MVITEEKMSSLISQDYLFVSNEEIILFTNGVVAVLENGKIKMVYGDYHLNTEYTTNIKDITKLEKEFNIKLVGIVQNQSSNYIHDKYSLILTDDNRFFDFSNIWHSLEDSFFQLQDILTYKIFGDKQSYYNLLNTVPIGLVYGGLAEDYFVSKEQFEDILKNKSNWLSDEEKYKLIYYYDIDALLEVYLASRKCM